MNDYTQAPAAGDAGSSVVSIIWIVLVVTTIVGLWKMFTKAGKPGWAAIVPFYNVYVMLKMAGRPGWWLILMLIPLVNIVVSFIVAIDLAHAFGRSTAFGVVALGLFSFIGYMMLGFGKDQYTAPVVAVPAAPTPSPQA